MMKDFGSRMKLAPKRASKIGKAVVAVVSAETQVSTVEILDSLPKVLTISH
jgi:hypothetical protein